MYQPQYPLLPFLSFPPPYLLSTPIHSSERGFTKPLRQQCSTSELHSKDKDDFKMKKKSIYSLNKGWQGILKVMFKSKDVLYTWRFFFDPQWYSTVHILFTLGDSKENLFEITLFIYLFFFGNFTSTCIQRCFSPRCILQCCDSLFSWEILEVPHIPPPFHNFLNFTYRLLLNSAYFPFLGTQVLPVFCRVLWLGFP